jgi:type I restriction enzyme S subunit
VSWPLVKLGDVAELINGDRSSNYPSGEDIVDKGILFLNTKNIIENKINLNQRSYITQDKFASLSRGKLQKKDLIITLRGTLGSCCIFDTEFDTGFINAQMMIIRCNDGVFNKYLHYYLTSFAVNFEFQRANTGSAVPQLTGRQIAELEIPLPPLDEQKRIAAILDKADAIRRKRQQAIQLADEFLHSVFLDMFGDPVRNPKDFPKGTIRDFVETANYGSSGKASETEGEYPMLRMGNITYEGGWDFTKLKYIDLSEKDKPKYLTQKGDLLFNRTNSKELVGKTAVFEEEKPMAIAGYLVRIRTNECGNNYYLSGYLNSTHGKKTLVGMCKSIVGMANINAQEVQNIKIVLPPIQLQNRFEQIVKDVNFKVKKHEKSQKSLGDLFNSLSQKAFAGEL